MAKNWLPIEAINVVREGKDTEAIVDIGKRYPLLVANCMTEAGLLKIVEAIPKHISARQIHKGLLGEIDEDAATETDAPADEKEVKETKVKDTNKADKAAKNDADDWGAEDEATKSYADMTTDELKTALKERKLTPEKGATKAAVIKLLESYDKKQKAAAEKASKTTKPADDDDWEV